MRARSWKTERADLRALLRGGVSTALNLAMSPHLVHPERARALAAEVLQAVRDELDRPRQEALWRRRRAR